MNKPVLSIYPHTRGVGLCLPDERPSSACFVFEARYKIVSSGKVAVPRFEAQKQNTVL